MKRITFLYKTAETPLELFSVLYSSLFDAVRFFIIVSYFRETMSKICKTSSKDFQEAVFLSKTIKLDYIKNFFHQHKLWPHIIQVDFHVWCIKFIWLLLSHTESPKLGIYTGHAETSFICTKTIYVICSIFFML